jgi:hypothetical protein
MEEHINLLTDAFDSDSLAVEEVSNKLKMIVNDSTAIKLRADLQKQFLEYRDRADDSKQTCADYRLRISMRETELLQVFHELISCDFWVSENYFDLYNENQKK